MRTAIIISFQQLTKYCNTQNGCLVVIVFVLAIAVCICEYCNVWCRANMYIIKLLFELNLN